MKSVFDGIDLSEEKPRSVFDGIDLSEEEPMSVFDGIDLSAQYDPSEIDMHSFTQFDLGEEESMKKLPPPKPTFKGFEAMSKIEEISALPELTLAQRFKESALGAKWRDLKRAWPGISKTLEKPLGAIITGTDITPREQLEIGGEVVKERSKALYEKMIGTPIKLAKGELTEKEEKALLNDPTTIPDPFGVRELTAKSIGGAIPLKVIDEWTKESGLEGKINTKAAKMVGKMGRYYLLSSWAASDLPIFQKVFATVGERAPFIANIATKGLANAEVFGANEMIEQVAKYCNKEKELSLDNIAGSAKAIGEEMGFSGVAGGIQGGLIDFNVLGFDIKTPLYMGTSVFWERARALRNDGKITEKEVGDIVIAVGMRGLFSHYLNGLGKKNWEAKKEFSDAYQKTASQFKDYMTGKHLDPQIVDSTTMQQSSMGTALQTLPKEFHQLETVKQLDYLNKINNELLAGKSISEATKDVIIPYASIKGMAVNEAMTKSINALNEAFKGPELPPAEAPKGSITKDYDTVPPNTSSQILEGVRLEKQEDKVFIKNSNDLITGKNTKLAQNNLKENIQRKLDEDNIFLEILKQDVVEGTPGERMPIEYNEDGTIKKWGGIPSTYPEWMQNKKLTKNMVVKVIDKLKNQDIKYGKRQEKIKGLVLKEMEKLKNQKIAPYQIHTGELNEGDTVKIKDEWLKVEKGDVDGTFKIKDGKTYIVDDAFDFIKISGLKKISDTSKITKDGIETTKTSITAQDVIDNQPPATMPNDEDLEWLKEGLGEEGQLTIDKVIKGFDPIWNKTSKGIDKFKMMGFGGGLSEQHKTELRTMVNNDEVLLEELVKIINNQLPGQYKNIKTGEMELLTDTDMELIIETSEEFPVGSETWIKKLTPLIEKGFDVETWVNNAHQIENWNAEKMENMGLLSERWTPQDFIDRSKEHILDMAKDNERFNKQIDKLKHKQSFFSKKDAEYKHFKTQIDDLNKSIQINYDQREKLVALIEEAPNWTYYTRYVLNKNGVLLDRLADDETVKKKGAIQTLKQIKEKQRKIPLRRLGKEEGRFDKGELQYESDYRKSLLRKTFQVNKMEIEYNWLKDNIKPDTNIVKPMFHNEVLRNEDNWKSFQTTSMLNNIFKNQKFYLKDLNPDEYRYSRITRPLTMDATKRPEELPKGEFIRFDDGQTYLIKSDKNTPPDKFINGLKNEINELKTEKNELTERMSFVGNKKYEEKISKQIKMIYSKIETAQNKINNYTQGNFGEYIEADYVAHKFLHSGLKELLPGKPFGKFMQFIDQAQMINKMLTFINGMPMIVNDGLQLTQQLYPPIFIKQIQIAADMYINHVGNYKEAKLMGVFSRDYLNMNDDIDNIINDITKVIDEHPVLNGIKDHFKLMKKDFLNKELSKLMYNNSKVFFAIHEILSLYLYNHFKNDLGLSPSIAAQKTLNTLGGGGVYNKETRKWMNIIFKTPSFIARGIMRFSETVEELFKATKEGRMPSAAERDMVTGFTLKHLLAWASTTAVAAKLLHGWYLTKQGRLEKNVNVGALKTPKIKTITLLGGAWLPERLLAKGPVKAVTNRLHIGPQLLLEMAKFIEGRDLYDYKLKIRVDSTAPVPEKIKQLMAYITSLSLAVPEKFNEKEEDLLLSKTEKFIKFFSQTPIYFKDVEDYPGLSERIWARYVNGEPLAIDLIEDAVREEKYELRFNKRKLKELQYSGTTNDIVAQLIKKHNITSEKQLFNKIKWLKNPSKAREAFKFLPNKKRIELFMKMNKNQQKKFIDLMPKDVK